MQPQITFSSTSASDANDLFEKLYRSRLDDFLRNECVLDPKGVERVIEEARLIFIRTSFKIDCSLLIQTNFEAQFKDHGSQIVEYVQTYGPEVCQSFSRSLRDLRYTMMQETCRQLASLDERHIKRVTH